MSVSRQEDEVLGQTRVISMPDVLATGVADRFGIDFKLDEVLNGYIDHPDLIENWPEKFVGAWDLGEVLVFMATPLTPYSDLAGGHCLFMVIPKPESGKPQNRISNIDQLSPDQLNRVLTLVQYAADCQHSLFGDRNPSVQTHVALNYHESPRPITGYKMSAQSVGTVHFHVFSIRSPDQYRLLNTGPEGGNLPTDKVLREVFDPYVFLFTHLISPDQISARIGQLLQSLVFDHVDKSGALVFETKNELSQSVNVGSDQPTSIDLLTKDLVQIHQVYKHMYSAISACFVNQNQLDQLGYPSLYSFDQILANFSRLNLNFHSQIEHKIIRTLAKIIKSTVQAHAEHDPRIVLHGPAYTVGWQFDPEKMITNLIFTPHVTSTGNMVSALGYVIQPTDQPPDDDWIQAEARNLRQVAQNLNQKFTSL